MTHLLPMCPGGPRQFDRRTQAIRSALVVTGQTEMARRIGASFSRQSLDLSCSLLNLTRASRRASVPILGPGPGPSAPLLVSTNFQESVPQSSGTSMCSGQIRVAGQVGRGQVGVPGQVGRERSESGGRLDGAGGSPTLRRYLVCIPVPLDSPRRVSQLHVSGAFFGPERQCHESARRSTCVALHHRSSGLERRDTLSICRPPVRIITQKSLHLLLDSAVHRTVRTPLPIR